MDTADKSFVEKFNQAVRGAVTLALVACFCYLAITKEIDGGLFAQTVTMVISFWFATRAAQGGTTVTTGNGAATTTVNTPAATVTTEAKP